MKNKHPHLEQMVERLNAEYDKGCWWKELVDMPGVFVGLQGKNVIVSWRGALLLQIALVDGRLEVRAREKALRIHSSRYRVFLDKSSTHSKAKTVQGLDGVARYLPQICKQTELLATPSERLASRVGGRLLSTLACNFELKNKVVNLVTMQKDGKIQAVCIRPYASADLRGKNPRVLEVLRRLNLLWQQEQQNIVRLFQNQIFLWQSLRGSFFQARRKVVEPVCLCSDVSLLITEFDGVQREHGLPELVLSLAGVVPVCVGKPDNVNEKHLTGLC